MSFVTVLMAVLAGFVLVAPIAMAALLVRGPVPFRRPVAVAVATACSCTRGCTCAPRLRSVA
jgi:hypothetical protein